MGVVETEEDRQTCYQRVTPGHSSSRLKGDTIVLGERQDGPSTAIVYDHRRPHCARWLVLQIARRPSEEVTLWMIDETSATVSHYRVGGASCSRRERGVSGTGLMQRTRDPDLSQWRRTSAYTCGLGTARGCRMMGRIRQNVLHEKHPTFRSRELDANGWRSEGE